ncbi:hypothetical protein Prudu_016623, partial [Prunus dulcis]
SAAKGVRRHGVDPNRSRNEEVMPNRPRPPPIQLVATATILGTDLRRRYRWNRDSTAVLFRLTPASRVPESGRKTMISDDGSSECHRTSSSDFSSVSPPNRSSKAPGARQDFKRRPLRDRSRRGKRDPPPGQS